MIMGLSIRLDEVGKAFKGDGVITDAVKSINLNFSASDFVSLVGASGSGKSTLLSLIGTLDQPTEGQIFFDQQDVAGLNGKKLADFRFEHIGFIFQQFHLLPTLTVLENVMAPLFARKVSYNKKERALELLERVQLSDKKNSLPSQLSGGQQQRVAIARALIHEPDWLLADEPTGNLDTETGERIFELLQTLNKEKKCGVLFVTHDPALAKRANRTIEMKDGKVIFDTEKSLAAKSAK